jgi:hypothetical protein
MENGSWILDFKFNLSSQLSLSGNSPKNSTSEFLFTSIIHSITSLPSGAFVHLEIDAVLTRRNHSGMAVAKMRLPYHIRLILPFFSNIWSLRNLLRCFFLPIKSPPIHNLLLVQILSKGVKL